MTVECFEDIFDPKTHKVGQKINAKNPKNVLELQCLVNLVDWQIKNNKKKLHQQFELDRWMQMIKRNKTDKTMLEWKVLQIAKLKIESVYPKLGRLNRKRARSSDRLEIGSLEEYITKLRQRRI